MTDHDRPSSAAREDGPAPADAAAGDDPGSPTSADYTVAFSPRQVAVGFAIVASLVVLAARRRRRKRDGEH